MFVKCPCKMSSTEVRLIGIGSSSIPKIMQKEMDIGARHSGSGFTMHRPAIRLGPRHSAQSFCFLFFLSPSITGIPLVPAGRDDVVPPRPDAAGCIFFLTMSSGPIGNMGMAGSRPPWTSAYRKRGGTPLLAQCLSLVWPHIVAS